MSVPDGFEHLETFKGSTDHALFDEFGNPQDPKVSEPTEEELRTPYTAPGEDALYPVGIGFHGDWKSFADGMARHVRMTARAMSAAGLPIKLESIGRSLMLNEELHPGTAPVSWMAEMSLGETLLSVKQSIFNSPDYVQTLIAPSGSRFSGEADQKRVMKHTIIYTSWERDRVHPAIVEVLNSAAQVWVPCKQNRDAFESSGVKNVLVVPYAFDPEEHCIAAPRGNATVPKGKRFYSIGKWEPRKNHHGLMGAFLMAFKPTDKASLFIKTSPFGYEWANYPAPKESLGFWLNSDIVKANGWTADNIDKRLRVVEDRLSDEAIQDLHRKNNIYVSASRGEAVNIPAFEAKLAGNSMVYVNWGGPQDFAEETDIAVPYEFRPVHPSYRWPEKDAQWAEVRVTTLKEALLQARPKPVRRVPLGMHERFSLNAVGQQIREALTFVSPGVRKLWL